MNGTTRFNKKGSRPRQYGCREATLRGATLALRSANDPGLSAGVFASKSTLAFGALVPAFGQFALGGIRTTVGRFLFLASRQTYSLANAGPQRQSGLRDVGLVSSAAVIHRGRW